MGLTCDYVRPVPAAQLGKKLILLVEGVMVAGLVIGPDVRGAEGVGVWLPSSRSRRR
jgi:hypothetical protein